MATYHKEGSELYFHSFQDRAFYVARSMQKYGGGFVARLGAALQHADTNNQRRIYGAFADYWAQYEADHHIIPAIKEYNGGIPERFHMTAEEYEAKQNA